MNKRSVKKQDMSPRTAKQYDEIRQQKRRLIVEVALKLFATEGYHAASISKIAKTAGISKGLMYNYFESKEDLLIAVVDGGLDELISMFDNLEAQLSDEGFRLMIDEMFMMVEEQKDFWNLYYSLMMQPAVMSLFEQKIKEVFPKMMAVIIPYFISKGIEDPETEAVFFFSMLDGIGFDYIVAPELFPLEKIKQRVLKMYL